MAKKEFKAESKRLLELMIHSIYTHREIFLRELISNASDAIDKLYYRALSEDLSGLSREDFSIWVRVDKENRKLTVSDNGCGMTEEELENNLGVIAQSGSLAFKKEKEPSEDVDIIGQFGVGFYSAFMVAKEVTVITKPFGSEKAYLWRSEGSDGYVIEETEKEGNGTDIILTLKDDTEEEQYGEFLDSYRLQDLIKKYSDYIRYPIRMNVERSRLKEGSKDEYETVTETVTVNSMVPIWRKNRSELTEEDYNRFYREKFYDFEAPLRVIHSSTEGASTYQALLFIPAKAPYDFYTREYEKGLQLYANGVLIMEKCPDLLPDCFSFVRGLVDSEDLSLNISREMLQHDRQLRLIRSRLEKKIKSELLSMLKNDREKYETFFKAFGLQLKYGVYADFGANKELLSDLLLFPSSKAETYTSLDEYVERMKEDQKYIYYASGDNRERISHLPQTERLTDAGYEVLYLTDDVDEFALKMMQNYKEKEFKSVSDKDLGIEDTGETEEIQKENEENKELFRMMKETLGDRVSEVRLTSRLKTHPVCITSEGGLSIEMEKVLNAMPNAQQKVSAKKILEINRDHKIFEKLKDLFAHDSEKLKEYTELLYTEALLIEGIQPEDPVDFVEKLCNIMA